MKEAKPMEAQHLHELRLVVTSIPREGRLCAIFVCDRVPAPPTGDGQDFGSLFRDQVQEKAKSYLKLFHTRNLGTLLSICCQNSYSILREQTADGAIEQLHEKKRNKQISRTFRRPNLVSRQNHKSAALPKHFPSIPLACLRR